MTEDVDIVTPAPTPAPVVVAPPAAVGMSTAKLLVIVLGSNLFLGILVVAGLVLFHPGASLVPVPPDNIAAAAKTWRHAEAGGYASVATQIRGSQITTLAGVEPALKTAFTPAATGLTGALTQTLKAVTDANGTFTNQAQAADALDRAAAAMK